MTLTLTEMENKLEVSNQKLCKEPDLHQADLPQGGRFFVIVLIHSAIFLTVFLEHVQDVSLSIIEIDFNQCWI